MFVLRIILKYFIREICGIRGVSFGKVYLAIGLITSSFFAANGTQVLSSSA
jgi:hypothetical protein